MTIVPSEILRQCGGPRWPVKPRFSDEQTVINYAARVGEQNRESILVFLALNRLIYCKKTAGDCAQQSGTKVGAGGIAVKATSSGLALTSQLAAGTALGAAVGAATLGIGLVAAPLFAIFGAHAVAVAREQQILCAVANAWNSFAESLESEFAAGKIDLNDAKRSISRVHNELVSTLSQIEKRCNAACIYHKALDALEAYNQEVVLHTLRPGLSKNLLAVGLAAGAGIVGALIRRF